MANTTLHLRKIPGGEWQWRDDSRDYPMWYPLPESTAGCRHFILHSYATTQQEPVWDGESPEKWPVL